MQYEDTFLKRALFFGSHKRRPDSEHTCRQCYSFKRIKNSHGHLILCDQILQKARGTKLLGIIICLPVICSCFSDPKQTSVGQLSHVVKRPDVIKIRTHFLPIKRTWKKKELQTRTPDPSFLFLIKDHIFLRRRLILQIAVQAGRQGFSNNKSLQISFWISEKVLHFLTSKKQDPPVHGEY